MVFLYLWLSIILNNIRTNNVRLYAEDWCELDYLDYIHASYGLIGPPLHPHSKHPTTQIHYMFIAVVHLFNKKVKIERIYDHGRRLVLYGIAGTTSLTQRSLVLAF